MSRFRLRQWGWMLMLWAVGCAPSAGVQDQLGRVAHAPDPFYGPGAYLPKEQGLAKGEEPLGAGRGAVAANNRVGPSVDLRSGGDTRPPNGVTLNGPTTLGKPPGTLTSGDRKTNELAIDNPVGGGSRVDPELKRMNWPSSDGSWEQAQAALKARGVSWQRLEMISAGQWEFECFVPDPRDPDRGQGYRAKGPSELSAVKAVLDQIQLIR